MLVFVTERKWLYVMVETRWHYDLANNGFTVSVESFWHIIYYACAYDLNVSKILSFSVVNAEKNDKNPFM